MENKNQQGIDQEIQDVFMEAQIEHENDGKITTRCPACGGVWDCGECIECGHILSY